jgi:hypothetical protein
MDERELLTASEAARRFHLPDWAFLRMVQRGQIPFVEIAAQPWQKRAQRRYDPAAVAKALGVKE